MAGNHDQRGVDASAARQFCEVEMQRPSVPSAEAEGRDAPEEAMLDEIALRFQQRGMGAVLAQQYARDALAVLKLREAIACGGEERKAGDGESEWLRQQWLRQEAGADRLMRALVRARGARKSKLALGCMMFAMGRPPYGLPSERDLAREQDVSPEAVRQEREAFQAILQLPRAPHQKSEGANESYRGSNGAKSKHK